VIATAAPTSHAAPREPLEDGCMVQPHPAFDVMSGTSVAAPLVPPSALAPLDCGPAPGPVRPPSAPGDAGATHSPATHDWPCGHVTPTHPSTHWPAEQTVPAGHPLGHDGSTQSPLAALHASGAAHEMPPHDAQPEKHEPPRHAWPAAHATP